jgi:hypothetical protein
MIHEQSQQNSEALQQTRGRISHELSEKLEGAHGCRIQVVNTVVLYYKLTKLLSGRASCGVSHTHIQYGSHTS